MEKTGAEDEMPRSQEDSVTEPQESSTILPLPLATAVANLEALADTAEDFLDQVGNNITTATMDEEEVAWESDEDEEQKSGKQAVFEEIGDVAKTETVPDNEDNEDNQSSESSKDKDEQTEKAATASADKKEVDNSEASFEIVSGPESAPEQASEPGKDSKERDNEGKEDKDGSDWGEDWE
ncbi:hypothetical protein HDU96_004870 [Phlyctochytrium bullatum]|nr:hypothetical protein HDU96_004870 [Phlyctochytrium bullatum]